MRNWNWSLRRSSSLRPGFQTTYEELKLVNVKIPGMIITTLPDYLWGIETVVEVQHGFHESLLPDYLWGIETSSSESDSEESLASRLPMRNWNHSEDVQTLCLHRLPDYLWGIETDRDEDVQNPLVELPDYLWGIETRVKRGTEWQENASRLPMRNWNNNISGWHIPQRTSFQTTYEELKLVSPAVFFSSACRFQTTYEELKPYETPR